LPDVTVLSTVTLMKCVPLKTFTEPSAPANTIVEIESPLTSAVGARIVPLDLR
jgi:hypothetical protein